jgi:23S rRNA pseudouridine1911/1915/1917 synthase
VSNIIQHTVTNGGDRLDHYVTAQNLCISRSESAMLIKAKNILVNGKPAKPSHKIQEGDEISINKPPAKSSELKPKEIDFEVLFEDADVLVLNKPSGLVVHPGAGNYEETLVHGLLYHCKDLSGIGGVERPGIVHRLDKGTSGVMVIAKNDKAHLNLSAQFQDKKIYKEYLAVCMGEVEKPELRLVHLMKRAEINRKKFVVNLKKGKEAITNVFVIDKNKRASLVKVNIETGRTHQIRVHMSYIGHPIMGDGMYGGTKRIKGFKEDEQEYIIEIGHQLLHSHIIKFTHPSSGELLEFKAKLPADFYEAAMKFMGRISVT